MSDDKSWWLTLGEPEGTRLLVTCPKKKNRTEGGLYIPDVAYIGRGDDKIQVDVQEKERRARATKGFIKRAGLEALDMMEGRGWQLGDEVTFTQFAPLFVGYKDDKGDEHEAVIIDAKDVMTNISLARRLAAHEQEIKRVVTDDGTPNHLIVTAKEAA